MSVEDRHDSGVVISGGLLYHFIKVKPYLIDIINSPLHKPTDNTP